MRLFHIAEEKRTLITKTLLYVAAIAFFLCVIFSYYSKLYAETEENIINKGEINAVETANQISVRMSSSMDIITLASYTIDNMIKEHRSQEEILDYMTNETKAVGASLITDTTGIYGYINGEYLDGSDWVPEEGYDPTERPWYTEAKQGNGDIVLVDPYVDLDTGKVMIALTRVLCDGVSVAGIDLSMDDIQAIMEKQVADGHAYAEFIVSGKSVVIAHSNRDMIGKNIKDGRDQLTQAIVNSLGKTEASYEYIYNNNKDYMLYFMPLDNDWMCVTVIDATDDFVRLRTPLVTTAFLAVVIIAIFLVILMFSERKDRKTRELVLQTQTAMAASEAKTAFLSNMSHEIRTPVNAIIGMNEMILRESKDKSILEYSSSIKNAGTALLGLINDVLDFSKIEAGKIEIIPVDYNLLSVLNDLVLMVHNKADEKGLMLNLDFDKTLPKMLNGDEIRIKQIITNILTNAVKYTEKGSITFSMGYRKLADEPGIIILDVKVKDTGIGIKQEDIEKLFSKFERIEEKRNRNIEGAGLGLNITRSLLELMDSKLIVESKYGEGSVFSFKLKQRVVGWDEIGEYKETYLLNANNGKEFTERLIAPDVNILVVDDNAMNLMVIKNLIKQTKISIDTAEGGYECLRLCRSKRYDLIFLDHMMPGMDGIETLQEMKEDNDCLNKDVPVICLTANAVSGAKEQYLEAGFNDYLTKPIDYEKLEECLISYLPDNKVTWMSETEEDNDNRDENNNDNLAPLRAQTCISVESGIKNSGSVEAYLGVLKIFYEALDERADELNRLFEEEDYKDYTIKVHALKSSARIIGATEFGDKAQKLETAGKIGDSEYIKDHHIGFIEEYRTYKNIIEPCLISDEDESGKPQASEAQIKEAFKSLRKAAEEMNCTALEEVFEDMRAYTVPTDYLSLWKKLNYASNQYEYSEVLSLLDSEGV